MKLWAAITFVALAAGPACAHQLDEYLQGTILSIDKDKLEAQMTLTPGVAVLPFVIANIDNNADGIISEQEQRAYATTILRDLSLSLDGNRLKPQLLAINFPSLSEMKEGRGEIRLSFTASLPRGGTNRTLTLENNHQSRLSAYQVNCLVPRDPGIRIASQHRNYSQSQYQLTYVQSSVSTGSLCSAMSSGSLAWLSGLALLLGMGAALLWRKTRLTT